MAAAAASDDWPLPVLVRRLKEFATNWERDVKDRVALARLGAMR